MVCQALIAIVCIQSRPRRLLSDKSYTGWLDLLVGIFAALTVSTPLRILPQVITAFVSR